MGLHRREERHVTLKTIMMAVVVLFAAGCAAERSVVREDVREGRVQVSTVANPDPHEADLILAVLPISNRTSDKSLDGVRGDLADLIAARLAVVPNIRLVERQRLEDVLAEIKLGMTGVIDQGTAIQIGRLLGANGQLAPNRLIRGSQYATTIAVRHAQMTPAMVPAAVEKGTKSAMKNIRKRGLMRRLAIRLPCSTKLPGTCCIKKELTETTISPIPSAMALATSMCPRCSKSSGTGRCSPFWVQSMCSFEATTALSPSRTMPLTL